MSLGLVHKQFKATHDKSIYTVSVFIYEFIISVFIYYIYDYCIWRKRRVKVYLLHNCFIDQPTVPSY